MVDNNIYFIYVANIYIFCKYLCMRLIQVFIIILK